MLVIVCVCLCVFKSIDAKRREITRRPLSRTVESPLQYHTVTRLMDRSQLPQRLTSTHQHIRACLHEHKHTHTRLVIVKVGGDDIISTGTQPSIMSNKTAYSLFSHYIVLCIKILLFHSVLYFQQ